jgi:acylphosphatase
MADESRRLIITGMVQGVGYRYGMQREAQHLGISGWVRNRRDGSVEANICGNPEALAELIAWAHKGPSCARVNQVMVTLGDPASGSFEQRPSV